MTGRKVLEPRLGKTERDVFRNHLLYGRAPDRTDGRQAALATALDDTLDDDKWTLSPARVRHLAKACGGLGAAGEAAAARLERIRVAESVLAPSTTLFGLLLGSDGQTVTEVEKSVRRQWGASVPLIDPSMIAELETELRDSTGDADAGTRPRCGRCVLSHILSRVADWRFAFACPTSFQTTTPSATQPTG